MSKYETLVKAGLMPLFKSESREGLTVILCFGNEFHVSRSVVTKLTPPPQPSQSPGSAAFVISGYTVFSVDWLGFIETNRFRS